MADHKFKKGDRVIFANCEHMWKDITGTVRVSDKDILAVDLDKRPQGWNLDFVTLGEVSRRWARPLKPLSGLEQQIAAYVKAEMAQL